MKLTDAQKQHLYDLTIASDRPKAETAALVKHGLAVQGEGRYGAWVNATAKGHALAKSWPEDEQLRLMCASIDASVAPALARGHKNPDRTSGSGNRAAAGTTAAAKGSHQVQASAAPTVPPESVPGTAHTRNKRTRVLSAPQSSAPATAPSGAAGSGSTLSAPETISPAPATKPPRSTTGRRETPKPRPEAASSSIPNAVRVITGAKAVYYPVSMYQGLNNATKQYVITTNPLYRSLALAASERNDLVL